MIFQYVLIGLVIFVIHIAEFIHLHVNLISIIIKMNIDVFYAVRSIVNCQKKKKREYN